MSIKVFLMPDKVTVGLSLNGTLFTMSPETAVMLGNELDSRGMWAMKNESKNKQPSGEPSKYLEGDIFPWPDVEKENVLQD